MHSISCSKNGRHVACNVYLELAWSPLASSALASGNPVFLHPAPRRLLHPRWRGAPWCGWCPPPPPPPPSPFVPGLPSSAWKEICPANVFHLNIILERPFVSEPFQLVKKKSSMWGTLLLRKWVLEKGLQASRLLVATSNTSSNTTSSRHCSGTWDYQ